MFNNQPSDNENHALHSPTSSSDHAERKAIGEKDPGSNLQTYITLQNYNPITQYLHSIRYRHVKEFLSTVVSPQHPMNILEIGCGYGKSLEAIKQCKSFNLKRYLGIDIDSQFIEFCQKNHPEAAYQFLNANICEYAKNNIPLPFIPTAVIALECFEHIEESEIPGLIQWIASLNCPLFISVPNEVGPAILLKNIGSYLMRYVRHQEYTWPETFSAAVYKLEQVEPHGTGHKGFDWHWLLAVINQKFKIFKVGTSPWNFIPRFVSPSIYFYCKPR